MPRHGGRCDAPDRRKPQNGLARAAGALQPQAGRACGFDGRVRRAAPAHHGRDHRLYLSPQNQRRRAHGTCGNCNRAVSDKRRGARGGPGKPAVQAQPQAAGCGERHLPAGGFNAPSRKGAEGNCPGG